MLEHVGIVRKAKAQLELKQVRIVKGHTKGFYHYSAVKGMPSGAGNPLMQDMEKVKILGAFLALFSLIRSVLMSLRTLTLPAESLGGTKKFPIEEEDRREDVVHWM